MFFFFYEICNLQNCLKYEISLELESFRMDTSQITAQKAFELEKSYLINEIAEVSSRLFKLVNSHPSRHLFIF